MNDQKKYDLRDLCKFIWDMEKVNDLFNLKNKRVPVWQMVRMRVFYSLAICMDVYQNPHPFKRGLPWVFTYISGVVLNTFSNVFKIKKLITAKTLILEHPRSISHAGKIIDIYNFEFYL